MVYLGKVDISNSILTTFTIDNAAGIGSLTPKTLQASELSEPAGTMPIGGKIFPFVSTLLSKPLRTCMITKS